jgi:hypothetical protein
MPTPSRLSPRKNILESSLHKRRGPPDCRNRNGKVLFPRNLSLSKGNLTFRFSALNGKSVCMEFRVSDK